MPSATCAHFIVERTIDGITVAGFVDAELLDEQVIAEIDDELWELAYGMGAVSLLLNLGSIRLMSSRMLGVLLHFSRRFQAIGGRLKLCCIAPELREVFRIARYESRFEIYSEEMHALDSF
jgi:anti-sigma B factor antagonist